MNGFLNDLRFGLRQLAAKPGFATAAILTLALGIGANTAVFSVLNGYLLKPLPYPHGDQLVGVGVDFKKTGGGFFSMSKSLYKLIRKNVDDFSSTAMFNYRGFNVKIGSAPSQMISGVVATGSLFDVLKVNPALGRTFGSGASEPGKGGVAVISNGLWHNKFGADPDVIGRTIRLNGNPVRIIGVMPKGFMFPNRAIDIWMPMTITPGDLAPGKMFMLSPTFIGRLKPGVSLNALQTQLDAVRAKVEQVVSADDWQDVTNAGFYVHAMAYRDAMLNGQTSTLLLLQGAVLLVLLMTCVNVANLLLSRVLGRSHEIAMRSALGASRSVLARQLLIESLSLAVPGGLIGVGLGWLGLHYYAAFAWGGIGGIFNKAVDWRVGLAALAMVGITTALVSVLPIRHLAKTDLQSLLQAGGRGMSGGVGARRVRNTLVAVELTLATVLLAGSGLLLHSFVNMQSVNPGFRKDHVLIAGLLATGNGQASKQSLNSFYGDVLGRVRALPGVKSAGIARWAPIGNVSMNAGFRIRGRELSGSSVKPKAWLDAVGPDYFKALGMPILRGRNFDVRDTTGGRPVAIIDSNLAKKYFKGADPIGQQIKWEKKWVTIIGVVAGVRLRRLTTPGKGAIYTSAAQAPTPAMRLVIYTSIAPDLLVKPVREAVAAVDPSVAMFGVETMHQRLADSLRDKQRTMDLLLAFGCIALALAVVGVYGVLSYAVGQRVTECGVRLALGALPEDLLWLIVRDGLKLLAIGLICGLLLAVVFGQVLSSRLFHVMPFDPLTLFGTAVVLSAITLLASYLPARRAANLDPAEAITEP
ncbi:MAG TPA: ABC transporter permease [Gammaproteobacteria bacterium]|nr:ABC transporter permease [Gammaproteobacteria bacterium]